MTTETMTEMTPAEARAINAETRRRILDNLREHGPSSLAELQERCLAGIGRQDIEELVGKYVHRHDGAGEIMYYHNNNAPVGGAVRPAIR